MYATTSVRVSYIQGTHDAVSNLSRDYMASQQYLLKGQTKNSSFIVEFIVFIHCHSFIYSLLFIHCRIYDQSHTELSRKRIYPQKERCQVSANELKF